MNKRIAVAFFLGAASAFLVCDLIFDPVVRVEEATRWKTWLCQQPRFLAFGANSDSGRLVADTLCVRKDTSYRQPEPR